MGKFFSAVGDGSYRGRSYTIVAPIGPRKSIEMKIITPIPSKTNNGNGNTNGRKSIELENNSNSTEQNLSFALEKDTSLRYRKEQARCSFSYKNSWKSLKDLLLPGNICDQYRCPTIKERFECHQKESHNKRCDCLKHKNNNNNHNSNNNNDDGSVRRKNSRVSIRSGPDYDQYSDQSLPTTSKENKPLTKCRDTCQLKSSLVKRNYNNEKYKTENSSNTIFANGSTTPNDAEEIDETSTNENVIALKYRDTATTPHNIKYIGSPRSQLNIFTDNPKVKYGPGSTTTGSANTETSRATYGYNETSKATKVNNNNINNELLKIGYSSTEKNKTDTATNTESPEAIFCKTVTTNPETFKAQYTNAEITAARRFDPGNSKTKYANTDIVKQINDEGLERCDANDTNVEIIKSKYANYEHKDASAKTESLEITGNNISISMTPNHPPKFVDRGTSPNDNQTINHYNNVDGNSNRLERKCSKECTTNPDNGHIYRGNKNTLKAEQHSPDNNNQILQNHNNIDVYSNRLERKCSKECTTNPDNFHIYRGGEKSSKANPKEMIPKIEQPEIDAKEKYKFTRESLIFERPLCADIYTTTYKDTFTNPCNPRVSLDAQTGRFVSNNDNSVRFTDIGSTREMFSQNEMIATTCCNSTDFDTPTNDNNNDYVNRDGRNSEEAKQLIKQNYATTYRDAYRKDSIGHSRNYEDIPSFSVNPEYCSCSTETEFYTQPNTSRQIRNDNSYSYEKRKPVEESSCYDESTSYNKSVSGQAIVNQRSNNQSTLYSYKPENSLSDDVCCPEINRPVENCCNICNADSNTKAIQKAVEEWIYEVPMYDSIEKGAREYFNKIVTNLIDNLSRLSKQAENPDYNERIRNEINKYLDSIPLWYPGAKREQELFKRSIVDQLVERLSNVLKNKNDKKDAASCSYPTYREVSTSLTSCIPNLSNPCALQDNEIRTCITEWLQVVYSRANHVIDNKKPHLVDLVYNRIKPLLNIPVNTYNRKVILKSAIVNALNDLPVVTKCPRSDVQTYNLAKNLADSLFCIQGKQCDDTNLLIMKNNVQSKKNNFEIAEKIENVITNEIRKCFEEAHIASNNLLVDETGVILLDCFDIPDPEARYDAKQEIIHLLVNSANLSESEAKHLTNVLMRKARKILTDDGGGVWRRPNDFRQKKRCTVLVCTSIKEAGPISYYFTHLPKRKSKRGILKGNSHAAIDRITK